MEFQQKFVEFLKISVPKHVSLADDIADVLDVSKDSAYRRLRCETPFSLDEAIRVCDHFDLDTSELFKLSDSTITFKYNKLYDEKDSFLMYMQNFAPVIKEVAARGGSIVYAAEDVPLFHHFAFENLLAFKIFYWSKAVLNSDQYLGHKFHSKLIHPDIIDAVQKLYEAYCNVNSIEIWTEESVNSTLRQIVYFSESGQFEETDQAFMVLDEFQEMINQLQTMAEKSSKNLETGERNFTMYNSEVLIGNNCIMLELGDLKQVFLSHNTFNSLRTADKAFVAETENWIQNLIRKSTLISDVSEKHRFQFFQSVNDSIRQTREQIENFSFSRAGTRG